MKNIEPIDKTRNVARAIEKLLLGLTVAEIENAIALFDIGATSHGGAEDDIAAALFRKNSLPIRSILSAMLEFRKVILGNFKKLDSGPFIPGLKKTYPGEFEEL